ncbi:malonyl-[acyl-carrier protein] O-methyltransferase-like [Mya arenaria]|uniref:malonyl-[acyl-carrier protein] O-methyltransferase-like n=1 Tax=Mya arenaria TaxID=6604 RepID=UPI0022DFB166|nr:malonyl-[acyl-carrier protein] O-methyltransferase-like [Mya arenaria]
MSKYENYNSTSRNYDKQRVPVASDTIAAMIQFLTSKQLKDIHVLDAGCGTGNYSSALLERGLGQVTMIDASSGMLQQARDKLGHALADGRVKQMLEVKLPELPFPDKTFDAVMFNLVLHHLEPKSSSTDGSFPVITKAITEARRVIKKNGVLIVTTQLPNILKNNLWFSRINENLTERNMKRWPELDYYESTFSAAKFELVETVNILSKHYLNENEFYEGPLHDWWRDTESYWALATEEELRQIKEKISDLKERGELEAWAKERDRARTEGSITLFVCKAM